MEIQKEQEEQFKAQLAQSAEEAKNTAKQKPKVEKQPTKKTANFFSSLEKGDIDSNLFEIISAEIHSLFSSDLAKIKGVTGEYNAMLKRKNLLEAKLFKRRYEKM